MPAKESPPMLGIPFDRGKSAHRDAAYCKTGIATPSPDKDSACLLQRRRQQLADRGRMGRLDQVMIEARLARLAPVIVLAPAC